jgi:hypothetical protein
MKFLFLILLFSSTVFSQFISKDVISSSGKTQVGSNNKISWTLGETVVGIMDSQNNQVSNGYHQGLNVSTLMIEDVSLDLKLIVYPNPTSNYLNVFHPNQDNFEVRITDINGKDIFLGNITKSMPIDLSNYTKGVYFVTILNKDIKLINTYKIIKM